MHSRCIFLTRAINSNNYRTVPLAGSGFLAKCRKCRFTRHSTTPSSLSAFGKKNTGKNSENKSHSRKFSFANMDGCWLDEVLNKLKRGEI